MKVAALAAAYDLPVAPHGSQELHVHLGCAVPNALIVEYYRDNTDPMWGQFYKKHLTIDQGYASPPDRPGLGWEIDEARAGQHRVDG